MAFEQPFEDRDGGSEVVAQQAKLFDIVEVLGSSEAAGEVIAVVRVRKHLAAVQTQEDDPAVAAFVRRAIATEDGGSGADEFGRWHWKR